MKKLTPKDIANKLDGMVVDTHNDIELVYYHSRVRGYFLRDKTAGSKLVFISSRMKEACSAYNIKVK